MRLPRVTEDVGVNLPQVPLQNQAVSGLESLGNALTDVAVAHETRKRKLREANEATSAFVGASQDIENLKELEKDPDFFTSDGIGMVRERTLEIVNDHSEKLSNPLAKEDFKRRMSLKAMDYMAQVKVREAAFLSNAALENGAALEDSFLDSMTASTTDEQLALAVAAVSEHYTRASEGGAMTPRAAKELTRKFEERVNGAGLQFDYDTAMLDATGGMMETLRRELEDPDGIYKKAPIEVRESMRGQLIRDWVSSQTKAQANEEAKIKDQQQRNFANLMQFMPGEPLPEGQAPLTRAQIQSAISNGLVAPEDADRLVAAYSAGLKAEQEKTGFSERSVAIREDETFDRLMDDIRNRVGTPSDNEVAVRKMREARGIRREQADKAQAAIDKWKTDVGTDPGKVKDESLKRARKSLFAEFGVSEFAAFPDPEKLVKVELGMARAREAADNGLNVEAEVSKYIIEQRDDTTAFPPNIDDIVKRGDIKFGGDTVNRFVPMSDTEMKTYLRWLKQNPDRNAEKQPAEVPAEDIRKQNEQPSSLGQIKEYFKGIFNE